VLVLVAGWAVAEACDALAEQTGLGATFVGATLLAVTTSLPEVSTTIQAARLGQFRMAVSNIFGSNAMCVGMLFLADAGYRKGPVLRETSASTTFMAALGIVLTCVYLWGLLEREDKSVWRLGWDSAAVAVLYVCGMWVVYQLG
jgi:cation:H+ antiporter